MNGLLKILIVSLTVIVLSACDFSLPETGDGDINDGEIYIRSDLFVVEDPSDPFSPIVFYTDDDSDSGPLGTTYWIPIDSSYEDNFTEWGAVVKKTNGDSTAGYGIVFCYGDHDAESESMLTVMIRVDGYYQVAEVIGTDYSPFIEWTESTYLNTGYGNDNTIQVTWNGEEFVLSFNGEEIDRYQDTAEPVHRGGTQGFLAVVAPNETYAGTVQISFIEVE